jgi:hypothetical protein
LYVRIMASSSTQPSDPFGSVLSGVRELCAQVVEQPTWSISDAGLPELIKTAEAAASAVAEIECRLVAEADSRNLADRHGATSTVAGWPS